jgi:hypothetical protein
MPVLIVGRETTIGALQPRLFKGRVTDKVKDTAIAALRKANPGIDFERLTPGTVLELPKIPEIQAPSGLSTGSVIGDSFSEIASRLGDAVQETETGAAEESKSETARRRQLAKALKSKDVQAAAKRDPRLAEALTAAEAAMTAQIATDKANAASNKKAFRQWASDLDKLRGLLPD